MAARENGLVGTVLIAVIDQWREPRGTHRFIAMLAVGGLLVAGGLLVHVTGGTQHSYVHALYLPIVLAGFLFRIPGGIVTGLVAGIIVGPFMDLDIGAHTSQATMSWVIRTAFFVTAGLLVGELASVLNRRIEIVDQATDHLRRTYARTLRVLASMVAMRDEPTGGHCERVAHNACVVGRELGLDGREIELLYWAGLLHDLGKIAVPERILLKEGTLEPDEFALVQRHAAIGAELLESIAPDFRAIAEGVRTHHEALDGTGYPHGLTGEEIPLYGRILAVVDVFEALTSLRPYKEAQPTAMALQFLRDKAGSRFDPEIVAAVERLYAAGKIWTSNDPQTPLVLGAPDRFDVDRPVAAVATAMPD